MLVAFNAHAQIDRVFAFATCTVRHFVSFAPPAREEFRINDVIATFTINSASTWAATAKFRFSFAYDLISTNFRLSN